jgi:polyisoprenoid-binding protein YceI
MLAVVAVPAGAAPRCFTVDAARSDVEFRLRVFGFFSPGGHFDRIAGTVKFDPQHWEALTVSIRIAVAALESRPRFWRDELLGPRFFDQSRYPRIEFTGASARQTGPDAGIVSGTLTLRGITRPVALRARIVPGAGALQIEAQTGVRRSDFGLGGVLPLASEDVTIVLHLRAAAEACSSEGARGGATQ